MAKPPSRPGAEMLNALRKVMDGSVVVSHRYVGRWEWLVLYGVGAVLHSSSRDRHVKIGGKVLVIDMGYFSRGKTNAYLRFSLNTDHPQALLDRAPADDKRWLHHGLTLREDVDPDGPIILVGLGRKTREYLGPVAWEQRKFAELVKRFPGRRIIYRPKKDRLDMLRLPCERDGSTPIAELLKGAALVSCRHSNVAVDAVVAGVPFECEDGAAMWLAGKPYTLANRLEFVERLSWFQWHPREAAAAWEFIRGIV